MAENANIETVSQLVGNVMTSFRQLWINILSAHHIKSQN